MAALRKLLWALGVFALAGVYLAVVTVSYQSRQSLDAGSVQDDEDALLQAGARSLLLDEHDVLQHEKDALLQHEKDALLQHEKDALLQHEKDALAQLANLNREQRVRDAMKHLTKELPKDNNGTLVIDFNCATRRHVRPEDDLPPPPSASSALFEWVWEANEALHVLNEDLFGTLAERPPQRVIVVQVHRRGRYARWLLQSLSAVPGIESALLVLSHGHVDDALLGLAREVCFCRVARVFFPWSVQLWGDQFPGLDCVKGSTVKDGKPCKREPLVTVAKHHWWWLHNFVFNEVLVAAKYKGVTLFLEEDMYLSPDALHVLDRMQEAAPAADMYILNDNKGFISKSSHRLVQQGHWVYNLGLALHERAWPKIVRCAAMFCSYNDYNWDWTLQAVGAKCVPGRFATAVMRGSRLFHIGKCGGMHFHGVSDCDALVLEARALLRREGDLLFPDALVVQKTDSVPVMGQPNGGWVDRRDHKLCLDNANASLHRWGKAR
ncbi:alpha-1,6-mannosyl-glycoprotein 2-beta-N-acetylglucosaminyltransferase-like [Thrips palmi]|uniref:Alpha-1,6-mannosyl-glycoprotein 2-beta-N-acetylglucosaminyltransferase n=1 Tax=Thrips palmi TaxID=161013 RepID=A0A6P8YRH5_THRPL|nr:alpha-1,6-mannosyl-glycoprotein 2-beta-N-acetylglucosaminyltransferase-like [Thrips palmi]XP_034239607.1 alpha-1,6-mannosyl-glycoprotein 2-beta-N-acetylglucosaminyltransferase-like [Thrips palmi]XP_034239609.1 alpha-1,6-mannosyl-glycoprotein 2-beta-N-acetylglucosaminyltransferase-like [Thrips palmi]